MSKFPCTGCGCCCKRIHKVRASIELLPDQIREDFRFPYKDINNVCEKLTEDNQCSVYENRPLICDFEKIKKYFDVSDDTFNQMIVPSCNEMMDEDNIPNHLRIPL